MKIRNDQLSFSAYKRFMESPDDYLLYLMGLELKSPYLSSGKAYHEQIASALMGGTDHEPKVDRTIREGSERGIITTVAGVELHLALALENAAVHGWVDLFCVSPPTLTDWKTGRTRPEDVTQVEWYLAMAEPFEPAAGYVAYVDSRSGRIREVTHIPWNASRHAITVAAITAAYQMIAHASIPPMVNLPVRGVTYADDYPRNIAVCNEGDVVDIEEQAIDTGEVGLAFVRRGRRLGWVPKELIPKVHATEGVIRWVGMPTFKADGLIKKHGGLRIGVSTSAITL